MGYIVINCIVIWFLFGIISAVVASNKGRSGCGWFIFGVLLGPFGLVLALVMSEDKQAVERNAIATENMKKCPYCAEIIKAEAKVCRYCSRDIPAAVKLERKPYEPGKMYALSFDKDKCVCCPICTARLKLDAKEIQDNKFSCTDCKSEILFSKLPSPDGEDPQLIENITEKNRVTCRPPKTDISEGIQIRNLVVNACKTISHIKPFGDDRDFCKNLSNLNEVCILGKTYLLRKETADAYNESVKLGFKIERESIACNNCGEKILLLDTMCEHCKDSFGKQIKDKQIFDKIIAYLKWKSLKIASHNNL